MHKIIEFDQKCKACGGTGLFVLTERYGMAIICRPCKGSGHYLTRIEYEDFEGLEEETGIERVFEIDLGLKQVTEIPLRASERVRMIRDQRLIDYGGLPYRIWYNNYASQNEPFPLGTENRNFTCPAWWYQNADYDRMPRWDECEGVVNFGACDFFSEKDKCWMKWDWVLNEIALVQSCGKGERAIDF